MNYQEKKTEKKKKKKVLLAKTKLNSMAILTSKALIDSYQTKLKNLKNDVEYTI